MSSQNEYFPDTVSAPGETLLEILEERGMTHVQLADQTKIDEKTINEIIKGKAAITPEAASQFESVLGIPAEFWNARESNYRKFIETGGPAMNTFYRSRGYWWHQNCPAIPPGTDADEFPGSAKLEPDTIMHGEGGRSMASSMTCAACGKTWEIPHGR